MNSAAIILCAGKGTRMNDDSKNKVCFDCAGIPVIKRIINNMRIGGVDKFVIVIGHQSESVMNCLDGESGIVYVYQKEQKGTGHAALCGLNALKTIGFEGNAIVSMGDKIIAPHVIKSLLDKSQTAKAVWGVQPVSANYNGGRVVIENGKTFGVVELADVALMYLSGVPEDKYDEVLKNIRLNEKKANKVKTLAKKQSISGSKTLAGKSFTADEIFKAQYSNAGLYCFDVSSAIEAINTCGSSNAQGEIYLTDALEWFSMNSTVDIYEVEKYEDMLTYSTKPELRNMSKYFMRNASVYIDDIKNGKLDNEFLKLYKNDSEKQKDRYIELLTAFIGKYGDKKVVITRSPGRINLMGRHIDHRGGGINVLATDRDSVIVSSPRDDDTVNISNIDSVFGDKSFGISEELGDKQYDCWLDYLNAPTTEDRLKNNKGDWANYVKSAVLRAQFDNDMTLCGMDMMVGGNIPVAAGLSSSSGIVVAVMEAVVALNSINITDKEFVDLCGEGEWFVGSRGGAGDHAAMKCCKAESIINLTFKPFTVGKTAKFSDKYAVIVANSMIEAKKSEGSKDTYNAKVAAYEFAFMMIKKNYPEYGFAEFRDIAKVRPYSEIYKILKSVPETLTRGGIKALLPEYKDRIEKLFSTHADPKIYDLRGVTMFGISECVRAEKCITAVENEDYELLGRMMKISHNGDRVQCVDYSDEKFDELIKDNADISLQCGAYGCSTEQIDYLCDVLNDTDGVLGSEIVGAGLGGCVVALVKRESSDKVIETINKEYYDKYGYEHKADVYRAAQSSSVIY